MPTEITDGLGFVAVVMAYWVLDVLIRRDAIGRLLQRVGLHRGSRVTALWGLVSVALAATARWKDIPHAEALLPLACGLSLLLAWKVSTKDIDPVLGESLWFARLSTIVLAIAVVVTPAAMVLLLHVQTQYFDRWRHHAILLLRGLLAVTAYVLVTGLSTAIFGRGRYLDISLAVAVVLLIHISQYYSAGLAKIELGPKWYSWVRDNRLHHQLATAYAWGWARFVPWPLWLSLIRGVKWAERPLQAAVFVVELAAPLALLHPKVGIGFCIAWSVFHVGVLAFSGIWFWEWVSANAVLTWAMLGLPESVSRSFFGWHAVVIGTLFIYLFPLRNRLWGPTSLAWWDTPMAQRTHWIVEGQSGKTYELYGDFMCPHERLYAKLHGCFLAPVPLLCFHLGSVFRRDHRDALHEAGADAARLDEVRARFGTSPRSESYAKNHIAYLHRFLHAVNHGAPKSVLPRFLRWLKSPGGHLYNWGNLPGFHGQEPAIKCSLRFREHYFDGNRLVTLRDELVTELIIDERSGSQPCGPEPTAREMEHFLMKAMWLVTERKIEQVAEQFRPYS